MLQIIKHLEENKNLVQLLKEEKACLVGVSSNETKAILDAYNSKLSTARDIIWR